MRLPSTDALAYPLFSTPPCTIRTRLPTLRRTQPGRECIHLSRTASLPKICSPTRSLLPRRRSVGRSCLPYLPQPPRLAKARPRPRTLRPSTLPRACAMHAHSHRAFCRLAAGTADRVSLMPATPAMPGPPAPQAGNVRPNPGDAELDQVPFLSLLTLHFPSGKALSPSRALATKSRGGPPRKCPLVRRTLPLGNLGEGGLTLSRS